MEGHLVFRLEARNCHGLLGTYRRDETGLGSVLPTCDAVQDVDSRIRENDGSGSVSFRNDGEGQAAPPSSEQLRGDWFDSL